MTGFSYKDGTYTFEYKSEVWYLTDEPAFVFDQASGTLLRHGDRIAMQSYFDKVQKIYRQAGLSVIADDIVLLIAQDISTDEMNKFVNIAGHIGRWYNKPHEFVEVRST